MTQGSERLQDWRRHSATDRLPFIRATRLVGQLIGSGMQRGASCLLLWISAAFLAAPLKGWADAAVSTVISVNDYGAKPDSGEDSVPALQRALAVAAKTPGPCLIQFRPGRYDLFSAQAARHRYYVSNTASELEVPDPIKTIAVWLRDLRQVTIDGQGALLVLHGEMTGFVIDGCSEITIKNLSFDMADPSVAELVVVEQNGNSTIWEALPGTQFRLDGKVVFFSGTGWEFENGLAQGYDPERDVTWRSRNPFTGARVDLVGNRLLRLTSADKPFIRPGQHYQFRDGIRDQVGGLILKSRNVTFTSVNMHFMHGFGIVSQTSENLVFDRLVCEPRKETGRTCAAFADFLQFSGCRGTITVTNSRFNGAQDDAINIHGTHLRITGQPARDQLIVRFMHGQSYGFETFFPGDEVEYIRMNSLNVFGHARVRAVELRSPREILLTLDHAVPAGVVLNEDVLENITWTPQVEISHSYFGRIPTRGLLITTRRKVVIKDNTFFRTTMPAILIANDAKSWFESGRVQDVTIRNNTFVECGEPVISISPEGTGPGLAYFVHQNVKIEHNEFRLLDHLALSAKATRNLRFADNRITQLDSSAADALVEHTQCPGIFLDVAPP